MGTEYTTTEAFAAFDQSLKLDRTERQAAEGVHNDITNLLLRSGIIVAAFLQGSFARKTMIAPLRDIDKVVILSPAMANLTPEQVMDRIQACVAAEYPGVTFDRSRHALQIDFGATSFYFDTVPAWESSTDDDDVLIANRDSAGWDRSNTRELIRVVAQRNSGTNGRFIHQARMGKQAIKHLLDGIVPGLHVESWAYIAVTAALPHDEASALILEAGADLIRSGYTEPTGREVISDRLKPDVIDEAAPVLADAARHARQAVDLAGAGDHNEAIRLWHGIFGDGFPAPQPQDDVTALNRSFSGGGITACGAVTTARTVGQSSRPVRSWRPE